MPDSRLGPALNSSDQELADAARITPEDLAKVRGWLEVYGPGLAPLVDAEPHEREWLALPLIAGMLAAGVRYLWLTQHGVYYDLRRQRPVDPDEVQRMMDRAVDRAAREARQHTMAMRGAPAGTGIVERRRASRGISLVDWEIGMRERTKIATVSADITARGGVRRTHVDALARMQEKVAEQYAFLRRFAAQIESGEQPVDGRALGRAAQYVRSARTEHFRARGEVAFSVGYDQARTVLAIADHCKASKDRPGCPDEARKGWVPLAELVVPGDRTCRANCKCGLRYRNSLTGHEWGGPGSEVRVLAEVA